MTSHVAYFRSHGTIRATPLSPPSASTADLEAEFEKQWSEAYGGAPAEDVRTWIREQLTRRGQ